MGSRAASQLLQTRTCISNLASSHYTKPVPWSAQTEYFFYTDQFYRLRAVYLTSAHFKAEPYLRYTTTSWDVTHNNQVTPRYLLTRWTGAAGIRKHPQCLHLCWGSNHEPSLCKVSALSTQLRDTQLAALCVCKPSLSLQCQHWILT